MKLKPAHAVGRNLKMTPLQRIMASTGRRPVECRCRLCQSQCHQPCLGTPQDILRLMDAGYIDRLGEAEWPLGMVWGLIDREIVTIQARWQGDWCTFFHDGLCELHDNGLKPTEGRLSHHSSRIEQFKPAKSIGWAVMKEWLAADNADVVREVYHRYNEYLKQKSKKV